MLTPKQQAILDVLREKYPVFATRHELMTAIGYSAHAITRSVDAHICALRKLGHSIATVWGYGYKLQP